MNDASKCYEGKEVVWWYPPGRVICDFKLEGNWSWSQSKERWVEYTLPQETELTAEPLPAITSADFGSIAISDLQTL